MSGRRLIEEKLPLQEVNVESAKEKSLRHGHISTMHLWWARRPLAMSRTVVFGTLLPDPGDEVRRKEILDLLARAAPFKASVRDDLINPLRKLLAEAYPDGPPKVLDCFAGGGAIPLEALRLGCDVTAVDLNPVAYLIEKCVLEYPQRFGQMDAAGRNPLADDFVEWAGWVRNRVEPQLAKVFPADQHGRRPAVYFWARTMTCPNPACRVEIPLLSSCWLANSTRRTVWVELRPRSERIELVIRKGAPPDGVDPSAGTVRASSVTCPACSTATRAKDVREYGKQVGFGSRLYAVLDIDGRIRAYRAPSPEEVEDATRLARDLLDTLGETPDGTSAVPDEPVDDVAFRNLQNIIFGYDTWQSLFNIRQLFVLGSLCEAVRAAHAEMLTAGMAPERATAVATYMGLCVDRIADYNASFTTWVPTGEFHAHVFPRQAVAMVWDYVEIDPLANVSGSWNGAARWIELAIHHCSTAGTEPATVLRGNAQELTFSDETFDAVIVDPPYYFSILYADLSNFFYVWLKRSVGHLYPGLFSTQWTPKDQEVVQNRANPHDPRYISADEFEGRLQRALREIARVVKLDGVVSIVFAHTDVVAWEHLLRALQKVDLVVSTSWPMRSERAGRPLAQVKAALGSSVVLVCRPQLAQEEGFYDDVVRALEKRIAERLDAFEEMGLVGADYFVSAVGPAFEVFARYSRIVKLSGEEVDVADLMVLARKAVARHALRKLLGSESLTVLDAESLFYLTWRWAYLVAPIPADEAYKLEKAFDIDLGLLTLPGGLARRNGSTFAILGPHERKGLTLRASPSLVDVLHLACQLWDTGRRQELEELLGATGMGVEPGFWAMAGTLAEILPDGSKERTMLLGLTGNRDRLAAAAAQSTASIEELRLFDPRRS
jgi:adenine-specific DNA methylase